jgi:phospholipase C
VQVMKCYNETSVSVLSSLAMNFAVFDRWYSSVPGPTVPNRLYALTGTSHGEHSFNTLFFLYHCSTCIDQYFFFLTGHAHNPVSDAITGFPQRTIFDDIYESNLDFGIFYSDFPVAYVTCHVVYMSLMSLFPLS